MTSQFSTQLTTQLSGTTVLATEDAYRRERARTQFRATAGSRRRHTQATTAHRGSHATLRSLRLWHRTSHAA